MKCNYSEIIYQYIYCPSLNVFKLIMLKIKSYVIIVLEITLFY